MQRPTWARHVLATGILLMAAMGFAPPSQASPGPFDEGLPNVDLRAAERAPVPAETRGPCGARRRSRAARRGGGGPQERRRLLRRPHRRAADRPVEGAPEQIALDYVRAHRALRASPSADVDNLKLVSRAVSPDGITHLRFNQTLDGIESYDSGIDAHVTRDGRLITVNGAPVRGAA